MTLATWWVRRLVAIALLLIVLQGFTFWIAEPLLLAHGQLDESLLQAEDSLYRFRRLISDLAEPPPPSTNAQAGIALYLTGESDILAGAALQTKISNLIGTHGGNVSSLQPLDTETIEHNLRKIGLRIQFSAKNQPMVAVLRGIESASPFLFIDNLDIQSRLTPAMEGPELDDPALSVSFDVYGYMAAPKP